MGRTHTKLRASDAEHIMLALGLSGQAFLICSPPCLCKAHSSQLERSVPLPVQLRLFVLLMTFFACFSLKVLQFQAMLVSSHACK